MTTPARFFSRRAISFRERSPYSGPYQIGLPPVRAGAPDVQVRGGAPMVGNVPLASAHRQGQEFLFNPSSVPEQSQNALAQYSAQQLGDSGSVVVTLAAGVPALALKRPSKARVMLLIQNQNAVGVCAYAFDNAPSIGSSIQIAAGGNRLWDSAVPQGDLWLFSAVICVVVLEFINKDLTDPNT